MYCNQYPVSIYRRSLTGSRLHDRSSGAASGTAFQAHEWKGSERQCQKSAASVYALAQDDPIRQKEGRKSAACRTKGRRAANLVLLYSLLLFFGSAAAIVHFGQKWSITARSGGLWQTLYDSTLHDRVQGSASGRVTFDSVNSTRRQAATGLTE
jgi:hypothetical protein